MKKAYTDLEQSRKLAEILPLESADMWYDVSDHPRLDKRETEQLSYRFAYTPCWSLAALLDILPKGKVLIDDVHSNKYKVIGYNLDTDYYDEPLDACYEMIIKLKKQNLL